MTAARPTSRRDHVRRLLDRLAGVVRGSTIPLEPYRPGVHEPLCSFDGIDGLEECERYWVNAPYSFVTIGYDPDANEHRYYTVEPTLREDERQLLETLFTEIRDPLRYTDDDTAVETHLLETLHEQAQWYGATIDVASLYRLFYYLYRDFQGYGHLDPIMHDPHVEDISCDGYDLPIFVYHEEYTDIATNVSFASDELDPFVVRLAQRSGGHISIGEPMVEATLEDGSRAELALGDEVTPRGSAFTIRKYADEPFTPIDLLDQGTFTADQLAYLWLAIEHNKSLLFAGGTASGKTTSMNALSMFIPPRAKVLTIEDTPEVRLYHDNWLASVTRDRDDDGDDVTMYTLLRSALRHRPEYIIVGEVRGEEAITLFQAMNTGHTTYSTMHADSVQTVINRLESEPINVPRPLVQRLDILSIQTLTRHDGGRVRRNTLIAEIDGIDQRTGDLDYATTYTWDNNTDAVEFHGSQLLSAIRTERGWTQSELTDDLDDRARFLISLRDQEITDYRQFTAMVNRFYADKSSVLDLIADGETLDRDESAQADAGAWFETGV